MLIPLFGGVVGADLLHMRYDFGPLFCKPRPMYVFHVSPCIHPIDRLSDVPKIVFWSKPVILNNVANCIYSFAIALGSDCLSG